MSTPGSRPSRPDAGHASPVGRLLKRWRDRRRLSQLALAGEAGVSARHLSFVETGRAQPSREMLLRLAQSLDVSPRGRNELLRAAGFAAHHRETSLEAPELLQVRRGLDFILAQQEPYPALVLDRHWNILRTNEAAGRVVGLFLDPTRSAALGPPNVMRLIHHPDGLRPHIVHWEATTAALVQWLHRDLLRDADDEETRRLLDEVLAYPDVPRPWQTLDLDAPRAPFLAFELRRDDVRLSFFTTLASLGTPYDLTLHELRVECFFPADADTDEACRRLAAGGPAAAPTGPAPDRPVARASR